MSFHKNWKKSLSNEKVFRYVLTNSEIELLKLTLQTQIDICNDPLDGFTESALRNAKTFALSAIKTLVDAKRDLNLAELKAIATSLFYSKLIVTDECTASEITYNKLIGYKSEIVSLCEKFSVFLD